MPIFKSSYTILSVREDIKRKFRAGAIMAGRTMAEHFRHLVGVLDVAGMYRDGVERAVGREEPPLPVDDIPAACLEDGFLMVLLIGAFAECVSA